MERALTDQQREGIVAAIDAGFVALDANGTVKAKREQLQRVDEDFRNQHGRYPETDAECARAYRLAQAQAIIDGFAKYRTAEAGNDGN